MIALPVIDLSKAREEKPETPIWRSLDDLHGHPELRRQSGDEFMPGASEPPGGASRRQFLQIMGASLAMGGLAACRRPETHLIPFVRQPEQAIPGIPLYYATAMPFRGVVRGLLVESHEGRPTKIEGNPDHPINRGNTSPFEQASVLQLYDPDRSQTVRRNGQAATWRDFVGFASQLGAGAAGMRLAVLAEDTSSPTLRRLRTQLRTRFPQMRWATFSADGPDSEAEGMRLAFGRPLRPLYRFSRAAVIASFDADFLSPTQVGFMPHSREFIDGRRLNTPQDPMSRFYMVESSFSNTGVKADHRLRLRASDIPTIVAAVGAALGVGSAAGTAAPAHAAFVRTLVDDLRRAGNRGVVLAGDTQPPEVHALCMAINTRLGSIGQVVELLDPGADAEPAESINTLTRAMQAGQVDALLILGTNPVLHAPAELNFAAAMKRVRQTIHSGLYMDETAQQATWHVPATHYLEAWGDGRAYDGTLSAIQPLIAPLFSDAHSDVEILNLLATGQDAPGYDVVRATWQAGGLVTGDFEKGWQKALHDGFLPNTAYTPGAGSATAPATMPRPAGRPADLEVVFRLDPSVLDGSFSNVSWMQELPDPVTKIVWDNAAIMSPKTARDLELTVDYQEGRHFADVIELKLGNRAIEIPVWVMPGYPDGTIGLNLGYGRNILSNREKSGYKFFDTQHYTNVYAEGPLANGVGVNVGPIRPVAMNRVVTGAQIRKLGRREMIATTQEHNAMEGRPIVRTATYEEFRKDPEFVQKEVQPFDEFPTLWDHSNPYGEPGYRRDLFHRNQWGMAIDLNACIGCNACVVACNSENNIPNVGKDQVARGREMLWLRIDRYFLGDDSEAEDPQAAFQPMMCVHCEYAPCEPVCPVAATSHSADGINEMTYNRCIGTRYCSNNCPYKVRRFNYYNWTNTLPTVVQMANNPDVTVRFRGVMEKCTYCVQRVRDGQRRANIELRNLRDGEVMTACQEACPTQAIIFGDLNNPASAVVAQKRNPRKYEVLEELNTQPRTSYLGLVKNPNPALEKAAPTAQNEHA